MATIRRAGFGSVFEVENETVGIGTTGTAVNTVQVFGNVESPNANIVAQAQLENYQGFLDNKARISSNNADVNKLQGYVSGEAYYGASHIHNRDDGSQVKMVGAAHTTKKHSVIDDSSNFKSGTMGDVIIDGDFTVSSGTTYCSSVDKLTPVANFTVPTGTTDDRIHCHTAGSMRFNEDLGTLEFYTGDEWKIVNSIKDTGNRGRAVIAGAFNNPSPLNIKQQIQHFNISTLGNTQSFGLLTAGRTAQMPVASETRGIFGGGSTPSRQDDIDYITIASEGNGIDFGELTQNAVGSNGVLSSSTRGLFMHGSTPGNTNVIDYVEIATVGNALDFGDCTFLTGEKSCNVCSPIRGITMGGGTSNTTQRAIEFVNIASKGNTVRFGEQQTARREGAGCSNSIRGVMGGGSMLGSPWPNSKAIEFITMASEGNATYFGDLSQEKSSNTGMANQVRGVFAGGYTPTYLNVMEYVTIASTGSAQDFGDMTHPGLYAAALSDCHGGLGGF